MIYIKKVNAKVISNRIADYNRFMDSIKKYPKAQQIKKVNLYLNQLLPQYDSVIEKKNDYWATPKEFLIRGFGDCEDYVIIKYYSLLKLGFDEKKLFITVVKVKNSRGNHMVLSYFKEHGRSPLILDNLSFRMLPLNKRIDLEVKLLINSTGVYKLTKTDTLIKIANSFKKYQLLMKRMENERCS